MWPVVKFCGLGETNLEIKQKDILVFSCGGPRVVWELGLRVGQFVLSLDPFFLSIGGIKDVT